MLVCVGPLTNLAIALNVAPDLPNLLAGLVIMGGAFWVPGMETKYAECRSGALEHEGTGDGPTEAAGGIVDGGTVRRGKIKGLDPRDYLSRNDSYHYLQATDDLLVTGPTLTNVMDLQITLIA